MDVHLTYCLTARLSEGFIRDAVAQLSLEERARHDRFVFEPDRRDFAVAHALLRRSLSALGDRAPHEWTYRAGRHGKPALSADAAARTRLSFNLSHTRGLVACAVTREAEVGIDVEAIDRRVEVLELADRFFSQAEATDLQRCAEEDRRARFVEIWTLKEAYLKALGHGLSRPLHEFAFGFGARSSLHFDDGSAVPPSTWGFALFAPSDRHRMAIALNCPSPEGRRLIVRADPPGDDRFSDATAPLRVWPGRSPRG